MTLRSRRKRKKPVEDDEFVVPTQEALDDDLNEYGPGLSPESIGRALRMSIPELLEDLSTIHGDVAYATRHNAQKRGEYMQAKAARDLKFATLKHGIRAMADGKTRITDKAVEAEAFASATYQTLVSRVISAEMAFEVSRGVVQALLTKRDMIKAAVQLMSADIRMSGDHVTYDGESLPTVDDDE